MKTSVLRVFGWAICLASAAAQSQVVQANTAGAAPTILSSGGYGPAPEVVREIRDPATGNRWLLERRGGNSGGPWRMLLVEPGRSSPVQKGNPVTEANPVRKVNALGVLIRAGESLIVEEHTQLVDATLQAVALAPASQGETLRVRLLIGGRVVKGVVVAPGRALLALDDGGQR